MGLIGFDSGMSDAGSMPRL